jgi:hypothetical protein
MPIYIATIGIAFSYLALNLIIRSRLILETDSEKRKQLGKKIVDAMYCLIGIGIGLLLLIIRRPEMGQTYSLVGINLIFLGINGIFIGKPIKEPEADHTTLGRVARIIAQISKYLAIILMVVALVWAAWPAIKSLICQ